jgi:uncharacterized protein (DUF488 family)
MLGKIASSPILEIFAIGHSTRSLEAFVNLLQTYNIGSLVDVRTIPRSRHNPQFNYETLDGALRQHGINYLQMKSLGGLRHVRADSPNTGWGNASFQGYADYMQTPEFATAIQQLINIAHDTATAIMCAEALPWRCHRFLIADALTVRGIAVRHILSPTSTKVHTLNPMARIEGTRITYPGQLTLL